MLPGLATEADRRALETDKLERGDSPTPGTIVAALLAEAIPEVLERIPQPDPLTTPRAGQLFRALDVHAGYGVFAQQLRRVCLSLGVRPRITGVEICEARREHLAKWCDRVLISDWIAAEQLDPWTGDLALGNPDFAALLGSTPAESMPALLLRRAHAVLLYHTRNAFLRSSPGRAVWREYPPAVTWMVPGTVSHDGTSAVASDCYQLTLWVRGHAGPTEVRMLAAEPEDANAASGIVKRNGEPYKCWRYIGDPPGSEQPSDELPAAPGWAP